MENNRIFVCAASRKGRSTQLREALSRDLAQEGAEIVPVLARSEWVIILQSPDLIGDPSTVALVQEALKYVYRGQKKGAIRILVEATTSPREWENLPTIDGRGRYEEVYTSLKHHLTAETGGTTQSPHEDRPEPSSPLPSPPNPESGQGSSHPAPRPQHVPPLPSQKKQTIAPSSRKRKLIYNAVSTVVVLALLLLTLAVLRPSSSAVSSVSTPEKGRIAGTASFFSSGMSDAGDEQGANDGIALVLSLPRPSAGIHYYAWLLPDISDPEGQPVRLGEVTAQHNQAALQYQDPAHRNLLSWTSRVLVTAEEGSVIPDTPSSDRGNWKYYAAFPQQASSTDMMKFSQLDHLRHLLVGQPDLQKRGIRGGLVLWLRHNTQALLGWSTTLRDTSTPAIRRQALLHMLEYLDGRASFHTDLPTASPPETDPAGQIGLLSTDPQATPPGYIQHVEMHLQGLTESPGATDAQRKLAGEIEKTLAVIRADLEQARRDAVGLYAFSNAQLASPAAATRINDLAECINNAYVGHYDAPTGERRGGIGSVSDQIQHLATLEIRAYTP